MKLYQSITHNAPSGPTSAQIGAVHSSSLARMFQPSLATKPLPFGLRKSTWTRCPVGSQTNAALFQYSFGKLRAV